MKRKVSACIFDLDGVITDTAELHYQAWQHMADKEGYSFNREINEQLRGVSRRASLEIILHGQKIPEEKMLSLMEEKNNYYKNLLETITPKDILPGVHKLLQEIRSAGIKIALASASKNAIPILKKLELIPLFDAIADGSSVMQAKPQPDVFVHAAGQLKTPVAECVVIEDAQAGVEGAIRCGMMSIGIGPQDRVGAAHLRFDEPQEIVLQEVLTHFQGL